MAAVIQVPREGLDYVTMDATRQVELQLAIENYTACTNGWISAFHTVGSRASEDAKIFGEAAAHRLI